MWHSTSLEAAHVLVDFGWVEPQYSMSAEYAAAAFGQEDRTQKGLGNGFLGELQAARFKFSERIANFTSLYQMICKRTSP